MSAIRRYTVAVDFDGVLHQWNGDWKGHHVVEGDAIPGAIFWLAEMNQRFRVVILTTRGATWRGRRAVRRWLQEKAGMLWYDSPAGYGLEDVVVTAKKKPALVYLDDRALRFDGVNFPSVTEVHRASPWWKAEAPDERA